MAEADLRGGLKGVRLSYGGATVEVALFGAHILSWTTPGASGAPVERLWLSSCSPLDGSAPIRGGIPIAWPQFATDGAMPLHGFARERLWAVVDSSDDAAHASASLTLELSDSPHTADGTWRSPAAPPFPWRFRLRLKVTLGATYLQLALEATNLGRAAMGGEESAERMAFTTCLHTYFRSADSTQVRLSGGLQGVQFVDKVDGMKVKRHGVDVASQTPDSLTVEEAAMESNGFVDRIYCHENPSKGIAQVLHVGRGLDPSAPEAESTYDLHQSAGFSNTVVFNPWKEGKRGPAHPDFDDDGYKYMICVEPAVAKPSQAVELKQGESWKGECLISIRN